MATITRPFEASTTPFTWTANEGIAFASDLGLRPGHFPEQMRVVSDLTGTGLVFWRTVSASKDGDLLSVKYLTATCGRHITLTVFND